MQYITLNYKLQITCTCGLPYLQKFHTIFQQPCCAGDQSHSQMYHRSMRFRGSDHISFVQSNRNALQWLVQRWILHRRQSGSIQRLWNESSCNEKTLLDLGLTAAAKPGSLQHHRLAMVSTVASLYSWPLSNELENSLQNLS